MRVLSLPDKSPLFEDELVMLIDQATGLDEVSDRELQPEACEQSGSPTKCIGGTSLSYLHFSAIGFDLLPNDNIRARHNNSPLTVVTN